jgi:hypothetical protein
MSNQVQNRKLRSQLAFGCVGLIALCAAVMYFVGGHKVSVVIIASQAFIGFLLAYTAAKKDKT